MGDATNSRDPMLDVFIFEANQLIESLEDIMLQTDNSGSFTEDHINEIFRIMHTIKGSSAMMMINNVSKLAHSVEDMFYYIRESKPEQMDVRAICDLTLAASDFIKQEVAKADANEQPDGDEAAMEQSIKTFLQELKALNSGEPPKAEEKPAEIKAAKMPAEAPIEGKKPESVSGQRYIARVNFEDNCQMENVRAFSIVKNLTELVNEIYTYPEDIIGASPDFISQNGFTAFFCTDKDESAINSVFSDALFLKDFEITKVESYEKQLEFYKIDGRSAPEAEAAAKPEKAEDSAPPAAAAPEASAPAAEFAAPKASSQGVASQSPAPQPVAAQGAGQKSTKLNMISVNVNKLDSLLNIVGEIVISESMVTKNSDLAGLKLDNFVKAARQLRKLTDELQDIVMSIRMIPISGTFQKMQRIVRDMSRKLERDVEFVTVGEETEVDKNIIDHLSDPLMHLIRNSMDHGVEDEADRIAAGKSPRARITLSAQNTGGDILITVADDGRGLNKEKILSKARANGLLKKPESEMSERDIFSLILLPGFSTNENVTEYSGRGVGMDVVRQNIEAVGGSISIKSVEGQGTTTSIVIPLTLAIADAMELSIGDNIFTIPTIAIKESFRPKGNEIFLDNMGNEMIMIRGSVYPIVRLYKLFDIPTEVTDLSEGILIMVEDDNKAACLFADRLLGEQQIVVKPIPEFLHQYKVKDMGIEGCTILGNGSISLILSAKGVVNRVV